MTQTLGSTSIRYRSDLKISDHTDVGRYEGLCSGMTPTTTKNTNNGDYKPKAIIVTNTQSLKQLQDRWQERKIYINFKSLQWRHNERDGVSTHRRLDCVLNRSFSRRSKKTSKLRVTGPCDGNSPVTGEFPAQRISNAENVAIWWRHHGVAAALGSKVFPTWGLE